VTDHNARVYGVVEETSVRAGTCYVIVDFDDGRRLELEVIGDEDERPLTPQFIRVSHPQPLGRQAGWFQWRQPDDLPERDEDPSGDVVVTVTVRTPERAGVTRQEQAALYFAEILATAIEDVLDQELWPEKPSDERSGQVDAYAEAKRLDPPAVFAIEVKVLMYVAEETALDLLAKLYLLLDSEHARYPELWQDVFAGRGVRDATPSAFFVTGRVGGRDLPPTTIPLRYSAPRG
jgi:hypothetical protein